MVFTPSRACSRPLGGWGAVVFALSTAENPRSPTTTSEREERSAGFYLFLMLSLWKAFHLLPPPPPPPPLFFPPIFPQLLLSPISSPKTEPKKKLATFRICQTLTKKIHHPNEITQAILRFNTNLISCIK